MNNNISIKTLSQVHVGSGVFLHKGNDFIVINKNKESDIYVIDPNKLGAIIGTDRQSIEEWVAIIERGDSDKYIISKTAGHNPKEFSKRRITNFANFENTQGTLKECLHDGMGRPYIPGSSIKGAIRTTVVSFLARNMGNEFLTHSIDQIYLEREEKLNRMSPKRVSNLTTSQRNNMLNFERIEKELVGTNPNVDIFRYISVGDAFFDVDSGISIKQINLNIRERDSLIDKRKQQIVEAIGPGEESSFSLKIDLAKYINSREFNHRDMVYQPIFPQEIGNIPALFALINQHTRRLVEYEINYWENSVVGYNGQDKYIEQMDEILDEINICNENQCVLRLGQAIGWRFITGSFLDILDEHYFKNMIVPIARDKNNNYTNYDFPKSRRIDDESYVFGFVKLQYNP